MAEWDVCKKCPFGSKGIVCGPESKFTPVRGITGYCHAIRDEAEAKLKDAEIQRVEERDVLEQKLAAAVARIKELEAALQEHHAVAGEFETWLTKKGPLWDGSLCPVCVKHFTPSGGGTGGVGPSKAVGESPVPATPTPAPKPPEGFTERMGPLLRPYIDGTPKGRIMPDTSEERNRDEYENDRGRRRKPSDNKG